ncbi:MAG: hypothetical protein KF744_16895 [Taibaiella sp.]|nr:hypothetical protein [Taibaiella sp.]
MKSLLILAPALVLSLQSNAQKTYFPSSSAEAIANKMEEKCGDKSWSAVNGKVMRKYDNGQMYELIDTAGLLIYVRVVAEEVTPTNKNKARYKEVTEGYFSKKGCSEIYRLNYGSIRKFMKDYTDFTAAAKATADANYLAPGNDGKSTTINSLYRKYCR